LQGRDELVVDAVGVEPLGGPLPHSVATACINHITEWGRTGLSRLSLSKAATGFELAKGPLNKTLRKMGLKDCGSWMAV